MLLLLKHNIFLNSDNPNIDDSGPTIEEMEDVQSSDDKTSDTNNIEDSLGKLNHIFQLISRKSIVKFEKTFNLLWEFNFMI